MTLAVVGPAGWGESLEEPVARLGDRVRLVGFVPRGDLAPLYRGAAVVCYPSLWEGYGLPVAEALAAGRAGGDLGRHRHRGAGGGGVGLVVDPRDPDAIAGALATVLDDDDLADAAAPARRASGRQRRRGRRTAALTIAAYEEAAGR